MLSHVLGHCIDPVAALTNAMSLLASQGRLLVEVPNNAELGFRKYRQCWPWSDVLRHLHFFTQKSLHRILAECELEVERTRGYWRQFQPDLISEQGRIAELVGTKAAPGVMESWLFLLRTAFSAADQKYLSLRVHAKVA